MQMQQEHSIFARIDKVVIIVVLLIVAVLVLLAALFSG